uniref:RING-CH-type domain-containing protein n=1 Tax=Kalanchoe fedtschenkoi TaxID=63787 RepID=A0A7N0TRR0_KALFE
MVVVAPEHKPDCQLHDGSDSIHKVEAAGAGADPSATEISEPTSSSSSSGVAAAPQNTQWKKPNLFLQIPSQEPRAPPQDPDCVRINMPASATPTPRRVNFLLTQSAGGDSRTYNNNPSPSPSSRGKSPFKNLLPRLSFKNRGLGPDMAEAVSSGASLESPRENKLSISRSLSFIFTPRIKRTISFPAGPSAHSDGLSGNEGSTSGPLDSTNVKGVVISRSLSVPANDKDKKLKRVDSFFRVIPSTPRVREEDTIASDAAGVEENGEADGEDIPEEEAVCRICFVELNEGGQTLKLECSCRGELALAHQDCAVKWFSIKGNKTCDVCKQEVKNLPVTLLRIQSAVTRGTGSRLAREFDGYSAWNDVPILAIVSMLAYFCFLEELLAGKMNTKAISISLPFCCLLGLLSSLTSCSVVKRRFIWIYAATQFAFVVVFGHVFYSVVGLQSVLSILLATFAGFGVAITGSSVLVEFFRWRRRVQLRRLAQTSSQTLPQQSQAPESLNTSVAGSSSGPDLRAAVELAASA